MFRGRDLMEQPLSFPNLFVARRIYLTIPVGARRKEFSKLKVIKTFLRSSIQQERLKFGDYIY